MGDFLERIDSKMEGSKLWLTLRVYFKRELTREGGGLRGKKRDFMRLFRRI